MCKPIPVCYTVQRATVSVTDFSLLHSTAGKGLCRRFHSATQYSGQRSLSLSDPCLTVVERDVWKLLNCPQVGPVLTQRHRQRRPPHLPDCGGRKHSWRHALGSLIPDMTPSKGPWEELGHVIRSCPSSRTSRIWSCVLARSGQLPLGCSSRVAPDSPPPLPRMMNSNGFHLLAVLEQ